MKYVLINYHFDPSWVKEYTDDFLIYDRSEPHTEFGNTVKTKNIGNVDYDRLTYIIDNYDHLPPVFVLSKSNLFKYISREEFDPLSHNNHFTPLLTQHHKTYLDQFGQVCFYSEGMYYERNDNWYLNSVPSQYFKTYNEFAKAFFLPTPEYIPFAPGGNYIVTPKEIYKHPKEFYEDLRGILDYTQLPGEAQFIERSYYNIWR